MPIKTNYRLLISGDKETQQILQTIQKSNIGDIDD